MYAPTTSVVDFAKEEIIIENNSVGEFRINLHLNPTIYQQSTYLSAINIYSNNSGVIKYNSRL